MQTMEHPNGCVHDVRDDLVDRFKAAGWVIKAAPSEPPETPEASEASEATETPEASEEAENEPKAAEAPKKRNTRSKKQ